jgi:hypothetical protein
VERPCASESAGRGERVDHRGRGPFPGLRRGRPIGSSGASRGARMSLRGTKPTSNARRTRPRGGSSTTRASRLSSWMTRAPPQASTDGPYPRSPRVRWKLPGPGRLPAPVSARIRAHRAVCRADPARSHRHEQRHATLAAGHEVDGSETSASSTPRIAYTVDATPVPSMRQGKMRSPDEVQGAW